ncbi:MAG TPA: pyridoxal phosphate-dependent aminotransferase [Holophagaceae bacterium]|nr:pyridoxal phosphate-dependent aminotransferase [Holophagaceae bacterium]
MAGPVRISERALEFPDSPIRKLGPFADQARAKGLTVHPLNIGQPDIPTAAPFLEALRRFDEPVVAYGKSQGEPELREAMSAYYRQAGLAISPDEIVVTVGGSEALLFAMQIVAEAGDEVLVFEPFYTNYNAFAQMSGVHLRPLRTHAADGFHLPSEAEIRAAIGPRTKAILFCSPNNPTGTVLEPEELERLARIAVDLGLFLIADEVYREFVYEGRHTSLMELPGMERHAILVDSLSKRYSACGARIGCLATRNREVRDAAVRLAQGRLCPPVVEQRAAVALAELDADFFTPIREEYRRRRDATYEGLTAIPGVVCRQPKGAFYIMAELPVPDCEAFAKWLLTDFQKDGETLMLAPGPGFYALGRYGREGQGLNQVRLAYVLEVPRLRRAMEILGAGVEAFQGAGIPR